MTAYAEVCGFPAKDTVPVTYPHILGFPLHLHVMSDPAFPFARDGRGAPGQHDHGRTAPRRRRDRGGRRAPEELRPHPKGRAVDLVTEVTSAGELVWEEPVDLPAPRARRSDAAREPDLDGAPTSGMTWNLAGDLGRRYAAVSGDRNPIHLYPLTARVLGFKRQIAHGMWSAARCVAALENRLPDAVTVEVAFKKPIFLPGSVTFGARHVDSGYAFGLSDPKSGAPHLQGRATRSG